MACDNLVGNTPIVNVAPNVWAKMEAYNPTGSIKDRMVNYVLKRVIKEGRIKKGDTVVEATSGNTGIALSFFGQIQNRSNTPVYLSIKDFFYTCGTFTPIGI